jgi:hypothetical protein
LEPLVAKDPKDAVSKEEFVKKLSAAVPAAEWATHKDTILGIVAPTPIPGPLKVLYVLLFAVVGMAGSYSVAWLRGMASASTRTPIAAPLLPL